MTSNNKERVFAWGLPGALGTMASIYNYDTQEKAASDFRERRMKTQSYFHPEDMRNAPNDCNWFYICCWYIMSEEFMREFKDYIIWNIAKEYQDISDNFRREFRKELNWEEDSSECI